MEKSIKKLGYCPILSEVEGENGEVTVTYAAKMTWLNTKLAGTRAFNFDPKSSFKEVWADGTVAYAGQVNSGYTGTATTLDTCDDVEKDWYSNIVDKSGTVVEVAKNGEMPKFGLVVVYESTVNDEGFTEAYPYCYCTDRKSIKHKTAEEDGMDFEYCEHKLAAKPAPCLSTLPDGTKGHIAMFRQTGSDLPDTMPVYTAPAGE